MSFAIVRRLFNSDDLAIQEQDIEAGTGQVLGPEDLAEFKDVLDRYSKGDMHTRLSLWLYHRDLRAAFEVLEQYL
jgi:hypothetical protein